MNIARVCKNYFNSVHEIYNYKNNSNRINAFAALKILSYFTVVIPLCFAALYSAASLYGRISAKQQLSPLDKAIHDTAKGILKIGLAEVLSAYQPAYAPTANIKNLQKYSESKDYQRHAKTARIYYNSGELSEKDALEIVFQREPTNIAMGDDQYKERRLQELFGYKKSTYNDVTARKEDGSLFGDLPNTAAVYSETYLWSCPGNKAKKEIACISVPAQALDSSQQPHYKYYMKAGRLDVKKYTQEMRFLFKCIERAARDNKDSAFGNKGIKRLVLSKFGQSSFIGALSQNDKEEANNAYKKEMAIFLNNIKDLGLPVVMSEYLDPGADKWHDKIIIGDILGVAQERDLIVNAWDPHSAPGNGNDNDPSFDGAMGKGSGILLTQTSWLNETLRSKTSLVAVR